MRGSAPEEWRAVVRHLSDCDLCRRQVALVAEEIPADLPLDSEPALPEIRTRASRWSRSIGWAATFLLVLGIAWALLHGPTSSPISLPPVVRPKTAPVTPPVVAPEKTLPKMTPVESAPPVPVPPRNVELPPPVEHRPPVVVPTPPPVPESPFIVERTRSLVSQAIEVVPELGNLSRLSAKGPEPLGGKGMVQPSETLTSRDGGSLLLPDGSTLHLAPEAEVRVAWSQTLACTTVDVRSGDAVVDLGRTPKPLFVSHLATGVQLQKSVGRVCVSIDQGSLRTTLLSGTAEVLNRSGGSRTLTTLQSLVLRETGDSLESVIKPDMSRFLTLDPGARVAPVPVKPGSDAKPPPLGVLAASLAAQSYSYRVSGREVRDGVWSPSGIYTSTIENVTAARRADDTDSCHFQRGSRPWDELGKLAPGSRDAHLIDLLRTLKVPHQLVLELVPLVSSESLPRTEKVRDRLCLVWDLRLDPERLRKSMEAAMDAAAADGRLQKPDYVYWETLEGGVEVSALKFESRLMRVVDRRKVAYSYKTVGGLDRRTYQLETTVEFFSHGVAAFPLSADLLKRLNLGPQ
jgi:hypothetical protein